MSLVAMGELLIDFVALEDGVQVGDASGFLKAPGGAPANVAVASAKLGLPAAFIGQVGDDPFGNHLKSVLQDVGVNTDGLRLTNAARTMLAFVSLAEAGERSFVFYRHPSADMLITADDIAYSLIDTAEVFHFGSITLISEPSRSATLSAVDHARRKGKIISYDPNLRLNLWESVDAARAGMLLGLDYATLLKVSEEEVVFLTGASDPTPLWRDAMQWIAVTYGADGAALYTRGRPPLHVPSFSVSPVDTTGAGDGFVAGMIVGYLEHGGTATATPPAEFHESIVRFANAVGAIATTQRGAIPALPTRNDVVSFINRSSL